MNIQNLMKQAQKMQAEMQKKTEELNKKEFVISSKNNLVEIKILGNLEIQDIKISKDLVDEDDIDTLQDVIVDSINKAIKEVNNKKENLMPKNIPKGLI
ncbi:MAG: YbaB/EbfC family nucleoid-associated protein [Mycoplasmoidaceae bacterium]